jgi:hypothetical protein
MSWRGVYSTYYFADWERQVGKADLIPAPQPG